MKIATWNIARPSPTGKKITAIMETLRALEADILVLTETDICIDLGSEYEVRHSEKDAQDYFRAGERRVNIFSKYAIGREILIFLLVMRIIP